MTNALVSRNWLNATLLAGTALLIGVLAGKHPNYAVALAALGIVALLAFVAPVTHLTILLVLTTIVPYSIEGLYHVGGAGAGNGGLQASDLFLLTGLLRVALVLPRLRLTRREVTVVSLVIISCAFAVFEAWQGFHAGQSVANVGAEFRALAGGFAFTLLVMTCLKDHGAHRRMLRALVLVGLALGLWGIAQWTLGVAFNSTDFGVRAGVSLTTGGVGQLQGGLFVFPVAVTLAVAAFTSGQLTSWRERAVVATVLILNAVSLLLTFERTFWVATAVAILLVALRSGRARRVRALLSIAVCVVIGASVVAAVSPSTLQTAEQRLLSIGQYQTDPSIRSRDVESGFVIAKIRAKPLLGWGLADTIYWGQPWTDTPPSAQSYTHVGYLWLLWREGILGGGVILALLALSCAWPGRARAGDLVTAIKMACQVSIIALLIVNLTFPLFSQGSQATYMLGLLIAYCAVPVKPRLLAAPGRGRQLAEPAVAAQAPA
jgi:O-antigen ligase